MSKSCIGCKREISWSKGTCPFCGASQNRLVHHFPTLISLALVVSGLTYGAHVYVNSLSEEIRTSVQEANSEQLQNAEQTITSLQSKLATIEAEAQQLREEVGSLKDAQSSVESEQASKAQTLTAKLLETEKEVEKQKGRASWLGRENARLKEQITQLENNVNALTVQLQQAQANNATSIPSSTGDDQTSDSNTTVSPQQTGDGT